MKKYISVFAIMLMIFLAACSNQNISSAPTSNESNTQSNSVTKLEEGVWPHLLQWKIVRRQSQMHLSTIR